MIVAVTHVRTAGVELAETALHLSTALNRTHVPMAVSRDQKAVSEAFTHAFLFGTVETSTGSLALAILTARPPAAPVAHVALKWACLLVARHFDAFAPRALVCVLHATITVVGS